jgi:hypothetical protein
MWARPVTARERRRLAPSPYHTPVFCSAFIEPGSAGFARSLSGLRPHRGRLQGGPPPAPRSSDPGRSPLVGAGGDRAGTASPRSPDPRNTFRSPLLPDTKYRVAVPRTRRIGPVPSPRHFRIESAGCARTPVSTPASPRPATSRAPPAEFPTPSAALEIPTTGARRIPSQLSQNAKNSQLQQISPANS